jgi:hypothetical protein
LRLRADITGFDIGGTAPTNGPYFRRAKIGFEFAALELLDSGKPGAGFYRWFIPLISLDRQSSPK